MFIHYLMVTVLKIHNMHELYYNVNTEFHGKTLVHLVSLPYTKYSPTFQLGSKAVSNRIIAARTYDENFPKAKTSQS